MEICRLRATSMGGAAEKEPVLPYNSTLTNAPLAPSPPVIRMRPSCSKTTEAPLRASVMGAAESHIPLNTCGTDPFNRSPIQRIKPRIQRACLVARDIKFLKEKWLDWLRKMD